MLIKQQKPKITHHLLEIVIIREKIGQYAKKRMGFVPETIQDVNNA